MAARNTKKTMFLCVLLSFSLLIGCWDRIEVNDLAFVMGAAIDLTEENSLDLTIEVILPESVAGGGQISGGGDGGRKTFLVNTEGTGFADAVSKMQMKFSRKVFFGHSKGVIFGSDFAKKIGIAGELEYLMKFNQTRLRDKIYISIGKASDSLNVLPRLEESTMEELRELAEVGIGLDLTVSEILETLKDERTELALPIVKAVTDDLEAETGLGLDGSAIFKGSKMIGQIDNRLTRGLLWFRGEMDEDIITLEPKGGEGFLSIAMISSNIELIPSIEKEEWKITIKVETEDNVIQNAATIDLIDLEAIKTLEKQLAKAIETQMEATRKVIQDELNSDVLGFAKAFHRKYPDVWNEHKDRWDEIFPNVKVKYDIKTHIRKVGLSTRTEEFN